jgi:hypothetical protein
VVRGKSRANGNKLILSPFKTAHYTRSNLNDFFSRKLDFNFINALKNFHDSQIRLKRIYWEKGEDSLFNNPILGGLGIDSNFI